MKKSTKYLLASIATTLITVFLFLLGVKDLVEQFIH